MPLHTKILIGMAVGVLLGLFAGPKAQWLERDSFVFALSEAPKLYAEPADSAGEAADPAAALPLPLPSQARDARNPLILRLDIETRPLPSDGGWVQVRMEYTERLQLLDSEGSLAAALGAPRPGDTRSLWLKLSRAALPGGGSAYSPEPVSSFGWSVIEAAKPIGALFMRLIRMVIVPLVFASLLVGIASLGDLRKLGRLGSRTFALYLGTTAVAVIIGLSLATLVSPGAFVGEADKAALMAQFGSAAQGRAAAAANAPSMVQTLLQIVPENPARALVDGDMLPVIFFACIFGVALTMLGVRESRPVVQFFDKVQAAMVLIIHMVMAVAPFGVAALLAEVVGTSGLSVLVALLAYGLVVLAGLFIHAAVVYGGIARFGAGLPLGTFLKAIRPAQLIAFSTSSSAAALPVSLECAEQNLRISNPVASFVIPLGSTVNMDGTALYQGVAAVFIAQVFGMDLSLADQLGIVLTATMASIGAAGVPGAGMITLAMVLTTAGIPTVGVALILGIDRLLDMFRTAVNVTGDLAVAATMARAEGESLAPLSPEEDALDPQHGFEGRLHVPHAGDDESNSSG